MPLTIEVEQEDDGRWIAEVPDLPGVLAYGQRRELWLKLGGCLNVTVKRPECVSRLPTPPQFARLALHLL